MKKLVMAALWAVAVLTTAGPASAQGVYFGFGPRPYYEPEPYYAPRYRAPEPYYGGGGGRRYYDGYQRRGSPCQYGWTVQDGVCKPYRGY
jgi:hypothetical protein